MAKKMFSQKPHYQQVERSIRTKAIEDAELDSHLKKPDEFPPYRNSKNKPTKSREKDK